MELLISYGQRLAPGIVVIASSLAVLPSACQELRLMMYILMFVLCRDTMTPLGMWSITSDLTIRLPADNMVLGALSFLSCGFVVAIHVFEPNLRHHLTYLPRGDGKSVKRRFAAGVVWGCVGSLMIALPASRTALHGAYGDLLGIHLDRDAQRDNDVVSNVPPAGQLPLLLAMALCGNCLEEVLFRGCIQGVIEEKGGSSPLRSALCSAILFSALHSFLATSVTALGFPIIAFTLYEGLVASLLRWRSGLLASTLAHGGAIFLLASGRL